MGDVGYGDVFVAFKCLEKFEIGRLCEPPEQGKRTSYITCQLDAI